MSPRCDFRVAEPFGGGEAERVQLSPHLASTSMAAPSSPAAVHAAIIEPARFPSMARLGLPLRLPKLGRVEMGAPNRRERAMLPGPIACGAKEPERSARCFAERRAVARFKRKRKTANETLGDRALKTGPFYARVAAVIVLFCGPSTRPAPSIVRGLFCYGENAGRRNRRNARAGRRPVRPGPGCGPFAANTRATNGVARRTRVGTGAQCLQKCGCTCTEPFVNPLSHAPTATPVKNTPRRMRNPTMSIAHLRTVNMADLPFTRTVVAVL
jgi:hypothetical protein